MDMSKRREGYYGGPVRSNLHRDGEEKLEDLVANYSKASKIGRATSGSSGVIGFHRLIQLTILCLSSLGMCSDTWLKIQRV